LESLKADSLHDVATSPLIDLETPRIGNLESNPSDEFTKQSLRDDEAGEPDLEAGEGQTLKQSSSRWELVESIVKSVSDSNRPTKRAEIRGMWDGKWSLPSLRSVVKGTTTTATSGATGVVNKVTKTAMKSLDIKRESSYAVVTFTSRQAAVAARQCLSDGRGTNRWISYPELPIPPLADAASGELLACRNCCKPVTLSIPDRQKDYRKFW
jgi:hypothetical protein